MYGLLVVAVIVVAVAWLDFQARDEVENKFGLVLEGIAATAALQLDGSRLGSIRSNDDVPGEDFQHLRTLLAAVAEANGLGPDQVYVLRTEPQGASFVVMLQDQAFVGDVYAPPEELADLYAWVARSGDVARTGLYEDAHGVFISGLAPVLDAEGQVAGILHVDFGVDAYVAEARQRSMMLLGLTALLVAAISFIGWWTHLRLRRKVVSLLEGTRAIRREDYDHRVTVGGRDELASVASALNDVILRLKERFEMLKFLPRHTRQMIELTSVEGPVGLEVAQSVHVVILESDIRGFTKLSERLSPKQTIGMLNKYIRAQAEIVSAAGGSIDKYMGDAVLAVFDGHGMEIRALDCALAIQEAMARMNAAGVFDVPVRIGIGLAVGEVVMGNMGSESRMEHTVIGPTVNLAARLCSAARAGEVVVQEALWTAANRRDLGSGAARETVSAKGFSEPVPSVRVATQSAVEVLDAPHDALRRDPSEARD